MRKKKGATMLQKSCPMHQWHKPFGTARRCMYCDLRWDTWAADRLEDLEKDNARMQRILDDTLDLDLIFTIAGITPETRDIILRAGGKVNYDKRRYIVYPPLGSTVNINGHLTLPNGTTLFLIGDFSRQHDGSQLVAQKPR